MKHYIAGLTLMAATGMADAASTKATMSASPNLQDDIKTVVMKDLWEREGLNKRDRSLVTVTSTIAQGHMAALTSEINLALNHGVKAQELSGLISHLVYYSGLTAATEAELVLKQVFAERKIKLDTLKVADATPIADKKSAEAGRKVVNDMVGDISPGLAFYSNTTLNSDVWLRNDLTPRDRSLITVSALITQGNVEQLPVHVKKGLGNGLTKKEIGEVITQLAFYAGWPRAFSAAGVIKEMNID